jgi:hypothetical protein
MMAGSRKEPVMDAVAVTWTQVTPAGHIHAIYITRTALPDRGELADSMCHRRFNTTRLVTPPPASAVRCWKCVERTALMDWRADAVAELTHLRELV